MLTFSSRFATASTHKYVTLDFWKGLFRYYAGIGTMNKGEHNRSCDPKFEAGLQPASDVHAMIPDRWPGLV